MQDLLQVVQRHYRLYDTDLEPPECQSGAAAAAPAIAATALVSRRTHIVHGLRMPTANFPLPSAPAKTHESYDITEPLRQSPLPCDFSLPVNQTRLGRHKPEAPIH